MDNVLRSLEENATTSSVRTLQMINLQKAIIATGMFSLFDAELQRRLDCTDGFKEVLKLLEHNGNANLTSRFSYFKLAINVLKHGRGKSYEKLLVECENLPFTIKSNENSFFDEGDIDEVSILIKVDDNFLRNCAELINDVSKVIKTIHK
ncbi:hypothetical protein [Sphingobacterium cellulitidis]|uniref:Uncharacterized protein n=1 Tax=Sphingobacterium cellulitidis TaxID=1768011 RepID=A0A8H9G0S1_9SPHI|nr:hypothetical protein [Sphingobacterium soli]MBA8986453.1 hypothetical protein [Sphingobacterium soli]GGE20376.1 hypothetical protein GCM10011516_17500 [Sphingobacterium soli]